jgi:hypothetical protein
MGHVNFFANYDQINSFPQPQAASKFIPNYFKSCPQQIGDNPQDGTVKRCVPFLDALTKGFIIPLWAECRIVATNGDINIQFPQNLTMPESLSTHSYDQISGHPLSNDKYGKIPLKWINPWGIQTPKGYSCLITSPLNHMENKFKILDGIVDTDTYYNQINFPFIWTAGDGDFLLPKGMPLVQVIPFKRETFKSKVVETDHKKRSIVNSKLGTVLRNGYRNMFWNKKQEDKL